MILEQSYGILPICNGYILPLYLTTSKVSFIVKYHLQWSVFLIFRYNMTQFFQFWFFLSNAGYCSCPLFSIRESKSALPFLRCFLLAKFVTWHLSWTIAVAYWTSPTSHDLFVDKVLKFRTTWNDAIKPESTRMFFHLRNAEISRELIVGIIFCARQWV